MRLLRARHRLAQGDAAGALADVDAALALRPGDPALLGVRGSALYRLGRYAEARADLAAAEKTEYWGWASPLWYLAGLAALQDGDVDDGIARLESYVEFEPGPGAWRGARSSRPTRRRVAWPTPRARAGTRRRTSTCSRSAPRRPATRARAQERLQRALAIAPDHALAKEALARLGG